jgi:hypothetical protein
MDPSITRRSLPIVMDPFESQFPEAPDLSGEVAIVSYKPLFTGPYSCVYRGKLRQDGQMVRLFELSQAIFLNFCLSGGYQSPQRS